MPLVLPPLYAIVDADVARRHGWQPVALATAYLAGGARLLQIRAERVLSGMLLRWSDDIVSAGHTVGARVIINNRADIARLSSADGVHIGQDDLPVAAVRRLVGEAAIVGLSTHTPEQLREARRQTMSYVAVGPVYGTGTKETGYEPVGLTLVREAVREAAGWPVVAIGGITLDRAPEVLRAGAASVAVISDLLTGGDPAARVRAYVEALGAVLSPPERLRPARRAR